MSYPDFMERDQIYVIGPNQDPRLASVSPGAEITGIQFRTDTDAPFLLRARAHRVAYDNLDSRLQAGLQNVSLKYTNGNGEYNSSGYIPQNLVMPFGGQGAALYRVFPQMFYPAGAVIRLDVKNTSASVTLTNLTFYFRGVKLFPWNTNMAYTYPPKFRVLPFVYPINEVSIANPNGVIQNVTTNYNVTLQQFRCNNDADFVLRYGQAGPSFAPLALEMFMILRDENQKAYSNDYVHVEVLWGPKTGQYTSGGTTVALPAIGNAMPSVIYPEIYVPKNHLLYYDVLRKDSSYAGAATIPSYPVNLIGAKVYQQ